MPLIELKCPSGGTGYGQAPWNSPPFLPLGAVVGAALAAALGADDAPLTAVGAALAAGALLAADPVVGVVLVVPQAARIAATNAPAPTPMKRRRVTMPSPERSGTGGICHS